MQRIVKHVTVKSKVKFVCKLLKDLYGHVAHLSIQSELARLLEEKREN